MKTIKGPEYIKPMNDLAGLYVEVLGLGTEVLDRKALLDHVRDSVAAAGYDPDGKAKVGFPVAHGVTTNTVAVWFYDKLPAGPVKKQYTVIGVYRDDDYQRFSDIVWASTPENAEQATRDELSPDDPDGLIIAGVIEGCAKVVL